MHTPADGPSAKRLADVFGLQLECRGIGHGVVILIATFVLETRYNLCTYGRRGSQNSAPEVRVDNRPSVQVIQAR
jgi:hypothetical protein